MRRALLVATVAVLVVLSVGGSALARPGSAAPALSTAASTETVRSYLRAGLSGAGDGGREARAEAERGLRAACRNPVRRHVLRAGFALTPGPISAASLGLVVSRGGVTAKSRNSPDPPAM